MKKSEGQELKNLLARSGVWLKAHAGALTYGFDGYHDPTRVPESLTELIEKIEKVTNGVV